MDIVPSRFQPLRLVQTLVRVCFASEEPCVSDGIDHARGGRTDTVGNVIAAFEVCGEEGDIELFASKDLTGFRVEAVDVVLLGGDVDRLFLAGGGVK
jgi:hypothetical protein